MRKILFFSTAVLFLTAMTMFTSCQKDEVLVTRFDATMKGFSGGAKTVLDSLNLYWVPGDQIKVFGINGSYGIYESTDPETVTAPFILMDGNAGEGPYRAIYPASCADDEGNLVLPNVQMSIDGSLTEYPMYVESEGTFLQFDNICGIVRFKLTKEDVSVSSIEVTSDCQLTGTFDVAYDSEGNVVLRNGRHGTNSVTLNCSTPQDISNQHVFDLYMIPGNYTFLRIRIYTDDGEMCVKTLSTGNTFQVRCGEINNVTLSSDKLDFSSLAGELPGTFSIGNGVKVHFSCGNMQYTTQGTHNVAENGTATGTWRFASNQYDYIGEGNINASASYSGWIDLFGWGTSGWASGATAYMPYATSNVTNHYYIGGNSGNDLTGNYANADWAVYNAISNGGNQPNKWRCLTRTEWQYLLEGRMNARNLRAPGNINGVGGMFILPDDWTTPQGCTFNAGFNDSDLNWRRNTYTLTEWAKMETAGAVFLPAAGFRSWRLFAESGYVLSTSDIQIKGYYWSTSKWGENNAADYLFLSNTDYAYENFHQWARSSGFSVRPVRVITTSQQ